jgi:tetratricopeptide (TPR) repeat protein
MQSARKNFKDAEKNLRSALELQQKLVGEFPALHTYQDDLAITQRDLGAVLKNLGKSAEAEAAYRQALGGFGHLIVAFPRAPRYQTQLLQTFKELAQLQAASGQPQKKREITDVVLAVYEKLAAQSANTSEDLQAMAVMYLNLANLLRDSGQPEEAEKAYGKAAHLYQGAFAADPKLAEDLKASRRYDAACAASLAGCGQGMNAYKLDDKERARWRRQALEWLRLDLDAWTQLAADHKEHNRIKSMLKWWQRDPDLAGLRDAQALKKLPTEEQTAWRKFWASVAQLEERTMLVTPWRDSDTWVIKGQEVHQSSGTNYHLLLFGDPRWTDYDFEAEINATGAGEVGLVLRATAPGGYVKVVCGSDKKWNGIVGLPEGSNTWWILAQGQDGITPLTKDRWYPMRVEVRGNTFKMYLDGKLLASASSDQYPRGCVGLTTTNCVARFRNLKVADPSGKVLWEGVQKVLPKSMP